MARGTDLRHPSEDDVKELNRSVAIIGAGPVGLCLALDLAWRGVDCVLV